MVCTVLELRIGCTGWSFEGWKGPFYPHSMETREYLRHYTSAFDTTEINSTFYRIPSQAVTRKWHDDTPHDFFFTAKAPQVVTHENRLRPGPYLDQFLNSIRPLEHKMRVLLIQLPPSLSFPEARPHLEKMLDHLPQAYRYAVEGRHPSWFGEESHAFLAGRKICLVWNEVEGVENPAPVTSDFVYLRLIGDRSIPDSQFGKLHRDQGALIQKWSERIASVGNRVSLAVVMANNHFEGFAPATANKMRMCLGLEHVTWNDKSQKAISDFADSR